MADDAETVRLLWQYVNLLNWLEGAGVAAGLAVLYFALTEFFSGNRRRRKP